MTYANSVTFITETVTANWPVADPYQPVYFVNGLTIVDGLHFWFQIGLAKTWGGICNGVPCVGSRVVHASYEVWLNGESILPSNGGSGVIYFDGPVNQGDPVTITMNLANSRVYLSLQDQKTGAYAGISFPRAGAIQFQGLKTGESDQYGEFTGLMTEWYHLTPYYGNNDYQKYVPQAPKGFWVWMWVAEFAADGITSHKTNLFARATTFPLLPNPYYIWTAHADGSGAGEEYLSTGTFITGVNGTGGGGALPYGIVFSPGGLYAYVINQGSDNVSIINVLTNSTVGSISLNGATTLWTPTAIAINPAGTILYIAVNNTQTSVIDIINIQTKQITGTILLPTYTSLYPGLPTPAGATQTEPPITSLVVNPAGTYAFATSPNVLLYKIDLVANTVIGTEVDTFYSGPDGQCLEINPAYNIADGPGTIAMDPTGSYVYIPGDEFSGYFGNATLCGTPETLTGGSAEVLQISTQTLGVAQTVPCSGAACSVGPDGAIAISSAGSGDWGGWGGGGSPIYGFGSIPAGAFTQTSAAPVAMAFNPPGSGTPGGAHALYAVLCSQWQYNAFLSIQLDVPFMPAGEIGYLYANGAITGLADCPVVNSGGSDTWDNQAIAVDPNPNLAIAYITDYYKGKVLIVNTKTKAVTGSINLASSSSSNSV